MTPYEHYLALEQRLVCTPEEDEAVRDAMDKLWLQLTDEEHERLNART